METLNSLIDIRKNIPKYATWKKEQDDREARRQALHNSVKHSPEELNQAKKYGKTIIDALSAMDAYSGEKTQEIETVGFLLSIPFGLLGCVTAPVLMKRLIYRNGKKNNFMHNLVSGAGFIAASVPVSLCSAHLQKESAKVAKHHAREKELKDPRNFVIYTDEQINEAKKIAPSIKIEKKKPFYFMNFAELYKSFISEIDDIKNYKKLRKEKKEISCKNPDKKEITTENPSEENLRKAKLEQDILFRVTKKINTSAEDYAQNTEAAVDTLLQSSLIGGSIIGKIVSCIPGLSEKLINIATKNKVIAKRESSLRMAHNLAIPLLSAVITTSISFFASLNIQKEAMRVGRFKARQELLKDPRNFIAYTDEQLETVKDVKAKRKKKNFLQKTWDNIVFIPKSVKYHKEYSNYKKNKSKEAKQLREALKQVNITQEQINQAKNTQYKLFKTYEKIDEMSQKYSEDMEVFNNVTLQTLPYALSGILLSPFIYIYSHIMYGNKIEGINRLISGLSKVSKYFGSESGKKFLSEIESNISEEITERKNSTPNNRAKPVITLPSEIIAKKNKASLQASITDFKNKVNTFSEAELKEYLLNVPGISQKDLKHVNKKQVKKFINNCNKLIQNLPDEDINKIIKQIANLQVENPDAFNSFIRKNNIGVEIANTSIVSQVGYGYAVFSTVALWLLLNYFADIQKKACRIGVMKAMESLKDPAEFVDKYPESNLSTTA